MTSTQLIAACAWKGTLILLCAFAASTALRRASAAIRHFLWAAALGVLLLLPAVSQLARIWPAPLPAPVSVTWVAVRPAAIQAVPQAGPVHPAVVGVTLVWFLGALGSAAWFLLGAARMLRMVHRSAPAAFARGSAVPVRAGSSVPVPLAWGLWRPVILLPLDARSWPAERLRSAVLHEETHIQRRDLWTQALAQAVCCLYWFHPIVWLASQELRKERERACDDAVLRSGIAATEYAGHLMELARGLAGRRVHGLAMAERSDLETRVRALLDCRRNRRPLQAPAAAAIAICGILVLAAALVRAEARPAAAVPALRQTFQLHVPDAPVAAPEVTVRDVRPAPRLVAQAAQPRETFGKSAPLVTTPISGVVLDPTSARVAGCQVTASSIDGSNVMQTTRTNPIGAYKFDSLPPGHYLLRFDAPGFAPALAVADGAAPLYIKLPVGSLAESITVSGQKPPVVGVAPPPGPQRIRVGGNVQPAKLISQAPRVYPDELQQLGIEGSVVIKAVITAAGQPTNLTVVNSGTDSRLAQAAMDAVSQWRYQPTLLNGEPVAVETTVTVDFKLQP